MVRKNKKGEEHSIKTIDDQIQFFDDVCVGWAKVLFW